MPQRVINAWAVLLGLAGLALLAALIVLGVDVLRAARTGPRWKRRILAAAIALLGASGAYVAAPKAEKAWTAPTLAELAAMPLAETPQWQQLTAAWREAEEVAAGRRGLYPFDKAGQERLLNDLREASEGVGRLRDARQLALAEVDLLRLELARLTAEVQAKRPSEERDVLCYEVMPVFMEPDTGVQRLAERLPLLDELTTAGKLQPAVAAKVLAAAEAELTAIESSGYLAHLAEMQANRDDPNQGQWVGEYLAAEHRRNAPQVLAAARETLAKLRLRLGGPATAPASRPGAERKE